jgi:hypothetical protein
MAAAASDDEALRELLGAEPPQGVLRLPAAGRAALAEVIDAAMAKQREDLVASFHATLKHVPFPLRGVIKKVLLG